jgi:hypothetical protein
MFTETRNRLDTEAVPLWNAVFCMDCEVISNTRFDECPSCKGHSLVSLARMLGGSLIGQDGHTSGIHKNSCFDITITVQLLELRAEDLNGTLERLSSLISQKLEPIRATVHIEVQPSAKTTDTSNVSNADVSSTMTTSDHNGSVGW